MAIPDALLRYVTNKNILKWGNFPRARHKTINNPVPGYKEKKSVIKQAFVNLLELLLLNLVLKNGYFLSASGL